MQLLALVVVTFAGAFLILLGWHLERPPGNESTGRWRGRAQASNQRREGPPRRT